jgi:small glutamine-rich tetratricopeptide repeat-containing protein alpha
MAAQQTSKKRLALAIIDYLNTSLKDGTIAGDESESIEIATNCIAEAFKVDPTDEAAVKDAVGGQNLLAIYSVYEKLKGKSTASTTGASSAAEGRPATPQTAAKDAAAGGASAETKKKADELKGKGNAAMQRKAYDEAIDFYTQAIALDPLNPIYLSNRAAAYSGSQRHAEAKSDAEMATAADPAYTKAWSRLGLANFALGDAKASMEAYKKGIDAEGNGGSEAMRKGYETAKRRVEEEDGAEAVSDLDGGAPRGGPGAGGMPDLSSLAGMFGGGGGGGGGMPDFSQMMNNPMMRQMAENIMSNPDALNNLMSNPRIREMANQFGGGGAGAGAGAGGAGGAPGGRGGGGMPDLSSLMNDPSIAEM